MQFWLLLLVLAATGCDAPIDMALEANPERAAAGSPRSVTRLAHYPSLKSRALLWSVGLSDVLPVESGATLYRLEYWTTGPEGERTHASGLVAIPSRSPFRGVVSYQHPTRTDRTDVPSTPSRTALLAAIAFAGHGYVLTAPDYLGLGTSPGPHPYLHATSEASTVTDLLVAARLLVQSVGREWPEAVFLTGFSQGGHATLATQRALEVDPVEGMRVMASAPIAGMYNLSGIQFPIALEGQSERHSLYLGYVTGAYARVYGERLESVIVDAYARVFVNLYDGSRERSEIAAALPPSPREMFQPDFLRAYAAGEETWLVRALALNDIFDWIPQAPVRFYYGARDQDSPPADTHFTVDHMRSRGANVSAVNVGEVDHDEVALIAVPQIRTWFDQVTAGAALPR
ncbi:MAG TPA: hypothetical protein VMQ83_00145 [Gammaproteobacteria bacterium]|nr:hypothetical protein [Gammaproteobacteria bacterium]